MRRAAVLVLKERAEVLERREGVLHSERLDLERALRDPPGPLRPRAARRPPPQDHPTRRPRPRLLHLPVLRPRVGRPDRRPRDPAQPRRLVRTGTTSSPPARPCNRKKGNRLPTEAAMPLRTSPKAPGPPSSSASPAPASRTRGSSTCSPRSALPEGDSALMSRTLKLARGQTPLRAKGRPYPEERPFGTSRVIKTTGD